MKKVILFGTTQFSDLLAHYISMEKLYEVAAYTVDRAYIQPQVKHMDSSLCTQHLGRPLVPWDAVDQFYPPEEYGLFICVGYNQMNRTRERIFLSAKAKGYEIMSYVHPTATILAEKVGEGTIVLEQALIGSFAKVGKGNVIWAQAHIAHHAIVGDFNFFAISTAVAGNIHIGSHCFFGANCTIKNNITIGDYSLVGAGCYVSHNTEPYSVQVPARSMTLEGKSSLDMRFISE